MRPASIVVGYVNFFVVLNISLICGFVAYNLSESALDFLFSMEGEIKINNNVDRVITNLTPMEWSETNAVRRDNPVHDLASILPPVISIIFAVFIARISIMLFGESS